MPVLRLLYLKKENKKPSEDKTIKTPRPSTNRSRDYEQEDKSKPLIINNNSPDRTSLPSIINQNSQENNHKKTSQ